MDKSVYDENFLLKQTISDMIEDSGMQKSYIDKLKQDHKLFLEEVSQREEDLNKQLHNTEMKYIEKIDSQNEIIIQMDKEIREVKKKWSSEKRKLIISVRQFPFWKRKFCFKNTNVELRQKIKTQEDYVQKLENDVLELNDINKNMIISIRELEEENRNLAASIGTLKSIVRSLEAKDKSFECLDVSEVNVAKIPLSSPMNAEPSRSIEYNKKPKILILCDETGYGLGKIFSRIYGNTFNIQSIIKPSANFENVINDVIDLSNNYCLDDHIIILAGSNDFKTKKFPSFKKLNSILKICTNTNIILSSVPHSRNYKVNEMIYRSS
ncbi:hypothetical protein JTB14_017195 [Gonioctena quinquepunctata]|nr:hypothetical protein JTB14_017195 [Gonioctena quinquepunctata]